MAVDPKEKINNGFPYEIVQVEVDNEGKTYYIAKSVYECYFDPDHLYHEKGGEFCEPCPTKNEGN